MERTRTCVEKRTEVNNNKIRDTVAAREVLGSVNLCGGVAYMDVRLFFSLEINERNETGLL